MNQVSDGVAAVLARLGVRRAFGVVGSGNFHFTNALIDAGVEFIPARHEGGAVTMADAYARLSGEVAVVSLHQGCGLTNATTGIGEAAKSRTPLLVVSAEAADTASNFYMDQEGLARSVGASSMRITSAASALQEARAAFALARLERRTVLLNLPVDIQEHRLPVAWREQPVEPVSPPVHAAASAESVRGLADLLASAKRPVFIAGRGARGKASRAALVQLADRCGALLAEGAVAKGLFTGEPWSIGVSGGFSSPVAARLIADADVIVGWGTALNMWTTGHGKLIGRDCKVVQVDIESNALGRHVALYQGVVGEVAGTARAVLASMSTRQLGGPGYRSKEMEERLQSARWRDVPYVDEGGPERIDPRHLSNFIDEHAPRDRVLSVDSGNFMGYPSMYCEVPDEDGFCFTQAFQSIGLGLATGIGAALAQPRRFPMVACGDGGFLMGIAELETAVRLRLGMLIVVYNDQAYGAEVYQFKPMGYRTDTVQFPDTDIAAVARGFGADGLTVRCNDDLEDVAARLRSGLKRPLVVDAKVVGFRAWWVGKRTALDPQ